MAKIWVSPNKLPIKGTLETIVGIGLITDIGADGEPEWAGETEVIWDEQKTVERNGKAIFVDTDGYEWTFDQLKQVEEADVDN